MAGGAGLAGQTSAVSHVVIAGAGIAGLSAARALQKQGIAFTILEAQSEVGGLWYSRYLGLQAQVPWPLLQHAEFETPFKDSFKTAYEFPDGEVVGGYLCALADHFQLRRHIRFNSRLVRLERPTANGTGWRVHWEEASGDSSSGAKQHVVAADFVIMASGSFSSPSIPDHYKDIDGFRGDILPARAVADGALLAGKRVLVLGGGKSSHDMVKAAVDAGASKTVNLLRRAHWAVPERVFGVLPYVWISHSRFASFFLPTWYSQPTLPWGLEHVKRRLTQAYWAFAGWACKVTLGMSGTLLPEPSQDILADQYVGGLAGNPRMYALAASGKVQAVKGDVERFTSDSVVTKAGDTLGPFDIVIAATGYAKTYAYLPEKEKAALGLEEDGLWLFRHVLPPRVPGLAFVGSNLVTFSDWLTAGIQSEWLARVLAGKLQLPSVEEQEVDVAALKAWKRSFAPPSNNRACNIMLHMTAYNDQLITDMGYSTHRRGHNLVKELFWTLTPPHYRAVFEAAALEQQGKARQPPRRPIAISRLPASSQQDSSPSKVELRYGGTPVKEISCPSLNLAASSNKIIT